MHRFSHEGNVNDFIIGEGFVIVRIESALGVVLRRLGEELFVNFVDRCGSLFQGLRRALDMPACHRESFRTVIYF